VNDRWRTITIILAVILALLGGITAAVVITGGPSPAVLPSPTTAAGASAQPSAVASASAGAPSIGPSAGESLAPSSPTPVPSPTPQPNLTTIVFTAQKLDAQSGTLAGTARTFAFTSEGTGKVVVGFKGTASGGKAVDCLKPAGGSGICRTGTVETLTFTTSAAKTNWIATAIGSVSAAPTIDISLTFSSLHRSVKLTHGRFDGQAYPYVGATFKLTTPNAGSLTVTANWGGHPFDYALILEPASTPPHTLGITGNSNGATGTFPVTAAAAYKGTLANLDDGFGVTPLTMTVTWP
jgi:hypothetical protein